jgi:fumarate reductase subunit C
VRTEPEAPRYPVHVRKVPLTWWLRTGPFRRFAAREFTSLFTAAASVMLLLFLLALSRGPQAYQGFLRWLELPGMVLLSVIIVLALVYHALTWFRLSTRILVIRVAGRTVHPTMIMAVLVAVWLGASALVTYFHVWF